MTKQYPIVHLGNEMYMIDPTTDDNFKRIWGDKGYFGTMLASTDKSLNLPLLPAVEDNTHQRLTHLAAFEQGFNFAHGIPSNEMYYRFNTWWKQNQVAASAKKWSDEDMRTAFEAGSNDTYECEANGKDKLCYCRNDNECSHRKYLTADKYLESLKPKPIAVEVEMFKDLLLVDENNIVKVVKYIYENS